MNWKNTSDMLEDEQMLIWKYNKGLITYKEFQEAMEQLREDRNNE